MGYERNIGKPEISGPRTRRAKCGDDQQLGRSSAALQTAGCGLSRLKLMAKFLLPYRRKTGAGRRPTLAGRSLPARSRLLLPRRACGTGCLRAERTVGFAASFGRIPVPSRQINFLAPCESPPS